MSPASRKVADISQYSDSCRPIHKREHFKGLYRESDEALVSLRQMRDTPLVVRWRLVHLQLSADFQKSSLESIQRRSDYPYYDYLKLPDPTHGSLEWTGGGLERHWGPGGPRLPLPFGAALEADEFTGLFLNPALRLRQRCEAPLQQLSKQLRPPFSCDKQ
jgi:hypothetical protein